MKEKQGFDLPTVETSIEDIKKDPPPDTEDMPTVPLHKRQDFWAWFGSLLFFAVLAGAIFGIGNAKGWYAPSGYYHNVSVTSQQRFLPEPLIPEPGVKGRDGPGASGRWYYWRLKPQDVTVYTQLFIWLCYVSHQIFVWTSIYLAQYFKNRDTSSPRYSTNLSWFNWMSIGINVGFHLLHLLQTHITYDALASDVGISSSQCSVIMLIVYIFIIEYRDRGFVFGWPSQYDTKNCSRKVRLPYGPMYLVRKYHGYAFSWGAIYTFWYHPMENTWGHVLGFFHTYIILLQGSLAFTRMHLNKYWRFILESWVTLHGTVVAVQTGGPSLNGHSLWPMFAFGFSIMVVVTQCFTMPFWRKIPAWTRCFPAIILFAVIIYCYSWIPDNQGQYFVRMREIINIPAVLLLAPLVVWLLLWLYLKVEEKCKKRHNESSEKEQSVVSSVLYFIGTMALLSVCTVIGFLMQYFDLQVNMGLTLPLLTFGYSLIVSIQLILAKQMFPCTDIMPGKVVPIEDTDLEEKVKET